MQLYVLLSACILVPLVVGTMLIAAFELNKMTISIFLFTLCMAIWQMDVSSLFLADVLPKETVMFLFKLFRIGQSMMLPAGLWVACAALSSQNSYQSHYSNWLSKYVVTKWTVMALSAWSLVVYAFNWTSLGVRDMTIVLPDSDFPFYFPVYGIWGIIYTWHILSFPIIATLIFVTCAHVKDVYNKMFLRWFGITVTVTFLLGMFNFLKGTRFVLGSVAIIFYCLLVTFTFLKISGNKQKVIEQQKNKLRKLSYAEGLLGSFSHELRNLSSSFSFYPQSLMENPNLDEKGKRDAKGLSIASAYFIEVLDKLGDFLKTGKIQTTMHNIAFIIGDSLMLLEEAIEKEGIEIDAPSESKFHALVDKTKIGQVFLNVIKNAVEAFPADKSPKKITISMRADDSNKILIDVIDNGAGMDPIIKSKIFQPFNTSKLGGRGIGLALSRHILLSHGGDIRLMKSDSSGTWMRIEIPKFEYAVKAPN